MKTQQMLKQEVAQSALDYVLANIPSSAVLGIGTGSTVDCFIDLLAQHKDRFFATVTSSVRSTKRLEGHGIKVLDLNEVTSVPYYIDGADEVNPRLHMLKGGGGALTQEKIVADIADEFVCIVDESKWVDALGQFPLPIEVLPMAKAQVTRAMEAKGGRVVLREGFITDNGCPIIDVHGFSVDNALPWEEDINQIPGVVCCGFFARKPASVVFISTQSGVLTKKATK